jgi:hypothetical protein
VPVKQRVAKTLRPVFTDEAIELFLELESVRQNPRTHPKFQDKSRRLAGLLGLTDEWTCAVAHVNDGSPESGYPVGHLTDLAHRRVFAVRQQLLAICAERAGKSKAAAEARIEG